MGMLGESVFCNCPNLTSLTLPRSINALTCIDPNFLSGSSVQRVSFTGLPDSVFTSGQKKEIDFGKYKTGVIYKSKQDVQNVLNLAKQYKVPIIILSTNFHDDWPGNPDYGYVPKGKYVSMYLNKIGGTCSLCRQFHENVLGSSEWKNWFPSCGYFCIEGGNGPFGHIRGDY